MTQPLPSQEVTTPQAPDRGQGSSPADSTAAPDPRRRGRLAAAAVIVLLAAAVLAFALLRGDDDASGNAPADQGAQVEDQGAGGDSAVPTPADDEPADAVPADDGEAGSGAVAGSSERAAAFMDAVVMGDFPGALALGGADFQAGYDGDDGRLANDLTAAAGGSLPDNYAIESIEHDDAAEVDVLTVRVTRPDGSPASMLVQIGEENGSAVVVGFE